MAVAIETSGTQTATINTEHSLATLAVAKVLTLVVDTNNMQNDDILELRVYEKVLTGSTRRLVFIGSFRDIPVEPIKVSVPVPSAGFTSGFEATLKQTQGTGRSYDWSIRSV